jgi:hypothetical protein
MIDIDSVELMKTPQELIEMYSCGIYSKQFNKGRNMTKEEILQRSPYKEISSREISPKEIEGIIPSFTVAIPDGCVTNENWTDILQSLLSNTHKMEEVVCIYITFFKLSSFETVTEKDVNALIKTGQESINKKTIRHLLKDFMNDSLSFPELQIDKDNDNTYHLVDGNHRIVVLKTIQFQGCIPAFVCDYNVS